jgi:hypothetical protein
MIMFFFDCASGVLVTGSTWLRVVVGSRLTSSGNLAVRLLSTGFCGAVDIFHTPDQDQDEGLRQVLVVQKRWVLAIIIYSPVYSTVTACFADIDLIARTDWQHSPFVAHSNNLITPPTFLKAQ